MADAAPRRRPVAGVPVAAAAAGGAGGAAFSSSSDDDVEPWDNDAADRMPDRRTPVVDIQTVRNDMLQYRDIDAVCADGSLRPVAHIRSDWYTLYVAPNEAGLVALLSLVRGLASIVEDADGLPLQHMLLGVIEDGARIVIAPPDDYDRSGYVATDQHNVAIGATASDAALYAYSMVLAGRLTTAAPRATPVFLYGLEPSELFDAATLASTQRLIRATLHMYATAAGINSIRTMATPPYARSVRVKRKPHTAVLRPFLTL